MILRPQLEDLLLFLEYILIPTVLLQQNVHRDITTSCVVRKT